MNVAVTAVCRFCGDEIQPGTVSPYIRWQHIRPRAGRRPHYAAPKAAAA
jgi:hypothetical protein